MRIISKFQDYYDVALGLGQDPNLVYVRKTESVELLTPWHKERRSGEYQHNGEQISYVVGILGFCGRPIPYYEFRRSWLTKTIEGVPLRDYENTYVWSKEQYVEYLNKYPQDPLKYKRWYNDMLAQKEAGRYHYNYLNHFKNKIDADDSIFIRFNAPIILFAGDTATSNRAVSPYRYKCIVNPCLKDLQFSKFMEPHKAFQEISMYVGGVLPRSQNEMVEISDQDKRDKHGFDEASFKTLSPGKKANRRAK